MPLPEIISTHVNMPRSVCSVVLFLLCFALHGQYDTLLVVALDGSGEYTSIQAAIDDAKSYPEKQVVISIKPGIYREKVRVYKWNPNLILKGESPDNTRIEWDDHFDTIDKGRNSTFHTATLRVDAVNVRLENLTISNIAGPVGQAIALFLGADRAVVTNCRILGHQDTLFVDGEGARQYILDTYVEGTTDFIFGGATVIFENCTIHSLADSYITAASTPKGQEYGLVFIDCRLAADDDVGKVYLGRPWRSYARTAFVNCYLGKHIRPEGWHNWSSPEKENTVSYIEIDNTGPGANTNMRVEWSEQLNSVEELNYSVEKIFSSTQLPAFNY